MPNRTSRDLWAKIKPLARQMRHIPTPAENALWQRLRRKGVAEVGFRRQHPIDRVIVDFYCHEARLVVEVDGSIHEYTQEEDALRQEFIESLGLRVIRFSNANVLQHLEGVLMVIAEVVESQVSPPSPPSPP
ncbi:MAG: endonuclease domain-containing protein [Chloroflexota bacterium]